MVHQVGLRLFLSAGALMVVASIALACDEDGGGLVRPDVVNLSIGPV